MQSGGAPPQGGGGHGWSMVAGPPSSSASPTSSASAVSQQAHLGFDPMKHQQQQQQQQQQQWQALQQQLLRNPEGREAIPAYQAGIRQGGVASDSVFMQMQRMAQQHSQEEGQNRRQGFDQHMMNPMQQAYMQQYALQAQQAQQAQQAHQKSSFGMQTQQQMRMGMMGKDQDLQSHQVVSDQSQSQRHFANPSPLGQLMQGNSIRQMQTPQNVNLMAQLMPTMQSRMLGQQKVNEINAGPQQVNSPQVANEGSPHSDVSGHSGSTKARQTMSPGHLGLTQHTMLVNSSSGGQGQLFSMHGRENHLPPRQPTVNSSGMPSMPPPQSPANMHQGSGSELLQIQHARQQINRSPPQSAASCSDVGLDNPVKSLEVPKPPLGFTKQQLHVFKAQILAFRRIKKGEKTLPVELFKAIAPPPLEVPSESNNLIREVCEEKTAAVITANAQGTTSITETPSVALHAKEEQKNPAIPTKQEHEVDRGTQITHVGEVPTDQGKVAIPAAVSQSGTSPQTKDSGPSRNYHGPLFDFPFFTRKHDGFGSSMMVNSNNNLTLAYDVKDVLIEEGVEVIKKKRNESLKKIKGLLAVNLERKRIRPDLVLRLQIEEKKLLLQDVQTRMREKVDQQQKVIMSMPDRPYRKFVRLCERQRMELNRQVKAGQRAIREKQLKAIFQWRKKLLESHWAIRDARTSRNRGVAKYHEKMLREFSKIDDNQSKRMEALKNNDVERYREILMEQQHSVPGEAAEGYEVLSSFLSQTEEYLNKLGGKITAAKNQQEVEEAAIAASAAARAQGLSEEEVKAAACCAREEVLIRNRFSEMNAPRDGSSVSKYYTLAHAVSERVIRQPSMLRKGTLRDYQLVGLQWMLSLYNNKLNGILADEMGLGKTVQVMALIAYLMEFKSNYGPHLIIVPNAVLVNWKSELHNWLPNVSCIYYVGKKDQRAKLFTQEVVSMKFNVLVTTYEFIMFDKSKLSRVDWKYIVIDEAQRMKDRELVLARDLDKYRCQRRLLLTGTPLQNDLKELWSLLNLLLPEVFDNRKVFHDWFSQPFQKEGSHSAENDWLETEKKVIVIHRLHQILEPFMLRRRVEDVEGSLPPKISIILRCKMSAIQGVVYDWIKATGTIRVDPEDEKRKVLKSSIYQARGFKPLNNKIVELRKTCNHPLLNYPFFSDLSKDFLVKSCGKLWVLDRVLMKLHRTGHRVLLFSTMTKLLDILEEYLQWRRLVYRRIDGTTSLDDRESAINDFNSPDTDCFIFLLSIRAAGRGLNLQTADTVIIYDPDPNPKNEEQAVARAHRIGQTREVKVIYMEAVVDKVSSHQKEDSFRNGEGFDSDDDLAGTDRYIGSIESLIRNNIQQYKIEMADEVINAGRFDQRTTHEERRSTLESLLRDEERYQETVHDVPSLQEVNRMIARSEEEVELFDQMDGEFDWAEEMTRFDQVPKWLRAGTREVNTAIAQMSKKPSKNALFTGNIGVESSEIGSVITEKRRGRFKGKKFPNYAELDNDLEEFYEATSEEAVKSDEEIGDSDDNDKVQSQDVPASGNNHMLLEAGSSGSSSHMKRLMPIAVPATSSQNFGSRPGPRPRRPGDDREEGEISMYGDSHADLQQSGNLNHDHDDNENGCFLQPKTKRKRSIRVRPRTAVDRSSLLNGQFSHLPFQADQSLHARTQADRKTVLANNTKNQQSNLPMEAKRNPPARKVVGQPTRTNTKSGPSEHSDEYSKERTDVKVKKGNGPFDGTTMTEATQRRCKSVITKIQRRIDKEGQQIIPLLTDLWKRPEGGLLDLRKIELRVDRFEYKGVMDLIADMQVMLKGGMQYFGFSHEVRSEARKVHDLFFDIMHIAFPDTDFREARGALTFTGSVSSSSRRVSLPAGQTKRPKPITHHPDSEPSLSPRPLAHGSIPTRETRLGNSSTRTQEESRPLTHPGELVTCKKKRKEREKPGAVRAGSGSSASPLSPIGRGSRTPGQTRPTQSQTIGQLGNGSGASFGWANSVKRTRTDAGKRRLCQL